MLRHEAAMSAKGFRQGLPLERHFRIYVVFVICRNLGVLNDEVPLLALYTVPRLGISACTADED